MDTIRKIPASMLAGMTATTPSDDPLSRGRRCLLAGLTIELHQAPLGRFVQRVERHPTPAIRNGSLIVALAAIAPHQPLQCAGQLRS